jgi:hypothetical protein
MKQTNIKNQFKDGYDKAIIDLSKIITPVIEAEKKQKELLEKGRIESRKLLADYKDIAKVLQVEVDKALKVAIKDIKQLINDDFKSSPHYNDVKNLIEVKLNNLLKESLNLAEYTPYGSKRLLDENH